MFKKNTNWDINLIPLKPSPNPFKFLKGTQIETLQLRRDGPLRKQMWVRVDLPSSSGAFAPKKTFVPKKDPECWCARRSLISQYKSLCVCIWRNPRRSVQIKETFFWKLQFRFFDLALRPKMWLHMSHCLKASRSIKMRFYFKIEIENINQPN